MSIANKSTENRAQPSKNSTFLAREQVHLLYMHAPVSNTAVITISTLFYFILLPHLDSNFLLIWMTTLLLTASYRFYLFWSYKQNAESKTSTTWLNLYLIGSGLVGVAWSPIYTLMAETSDLFVLSTLMMLAFGVMSSAVPILSAHIPSFILYTFPQGLTVCITLLNFETYDYSWLGLAVFIYLLMITLFMRKTNQTILQSIKFQEENRALIEKLNYEVTQREVLISQRTIELVKKNRDLITEISERVRAEEDQRKSNIDLQATLQAIPDLLFELDENGNFIHFWANSKELMAKQNKTLSGKAVANILPPEPALKVMEAIKEAETKGTSSGQIIKLPLRQNTQWFELSTSKKETSHTTSTFLVLARDITDKKQMEDELFKAKKLESVGVLAGGIAHDFNNLLTVVLGNIELISYRTQKDNKVASLISKAQKATERATKLTQQLLTFSKGGDPVKEATSLSDIIRDTADFILLGSTVSCDYTFPDGLWMVHGDKGQVSQVVQNIILNAKDAMPDGGKINISCNNIEEQGGEPAHGLKKGNYVRITIEDSGTGIPDDIKNKIFDPYFTTKTKGSGLGLAICHAIITKHDGKLSVQSSLDKGTTFTIYLPALPAAVTIPTPLIDSSTQSTSASIMVMDDDEMIRDLLTEQIGQLGHEVIVVEDGEQAIEKYRVTHENNVAIDLTIMDLTIPGGMGGAEAARNILNFDPDARIVVASGYSNDPVMSNYAEYGFYDAIIKPFDLTLLKKCIDSALTTANDGRIQIEQ